jgi:hypothetical protein
MDMDSLIRAGHRKESFNRMEQYLVDKVVFSHLKESDDSWYWQSDTFPQLVLLKKWFHPNYK